MPKIGCYHLLNIKINRGHGVIKNHWISYTCTTVSFLILVILGSTFISNGIRLQIGNAQVAQNVTDLVKSGLTLNHFGKYNEAITYFDRALKTDPKNIIALTNKGVALDGLGKYDEEIKNYLKVLEIDPKNKFVMNNIGSVLLNLGSPQAALQWFDKAITIDPNNTQIIINKAKTLESLGKLDDAVILYNKVLAFDPNDLSCPYQQRKGSIAIA